MPDYTTTGLISNIKSRIISPTNDYTFTNQKYVDVLNSELKSKIVPLIMSVYEEFFVQASDTTITSSTYQFDIPANAIGAKLRDVTIWDLSVSTNPVMLYNVPRIKPEDLDLQSGFYIQSNTIILNPATGWNLTGKTMRMTYYKRLPLLTPIVNDATYYAGKVTAINSLVLTLDYFPTGWTTSTSIDVIDSTIPFANIFSAVSPTAVNSSAKTISLSSVTGITTNDYVCVTGESVFANIPVDLYDVLAQAASVYVLRALGDANGAALAYSEYQELRQNALNLISPRVDGENQKVYGLRQIHDLV